MKNKLNCYASLAFKELRNLEEMVKDSTPFASLDLYIRNQKQFEDAYQAFSTVQRFNGSAVQRFSGSAVQRFSGSTVQRFNGSAVQRFNGSAVQRFNGSTVQRFNGSAVQRFNGSTVQRFNASTLQRFNASTVQRFNGSTLLPACRRAGGNDFGEQSQNFRAAHGSHQSLFFESINHRHILLFAGQKNWQRVEQSLMWS